MRVRVRVRFRDITAVRVRIRVRFSLVFRNYFFSSCRNRHAVQGAVLGAAVGAV